VTDSNTVNVGSFPLSATVTGPGGYSKTVHDFESDLGGATFHVQLVETPTVTANFGGHFTHNVNVTPATETVNF